ncbi:MULTISPECIES: hypothetical protein [unclassified Paenibacillus]|uniref:hypothetical protein n=1 Tax=unclassified Paenibacillus TaxID=185978 RepID=UPI000838578E|nr:MULTISPECIES: hypothetical protein [unclassified Paenibacillus]NWL88847.1 hypothetical protein [Paenibacillus sp. 79R4]
MKRGAARGGFQPFIIGPQEVTLTSIDVRGIVIGQRIQIKIEVGWEKPIHWDTGEMEIIIRRDALDGPVVYWSQEACFEKCLLIETYSEAATQANHSYYLGVRSEESRAIMTGPYYLSALI